MATATPQNNYTTGAPGENLPGFRGADYYHNLDTTAKPIPAPTPTTGFSITVPTTVPSTSLAPTTTRSNVMDYRTQLQNQFNQSQAAQQATQQQILANMTPGQEEQNAQNTLRNLNQGLRQGLQNIENKAIPMQFVTGQQAALQRQGALDILSASENLQALTGQRQTLLDSLKTQLGFQTKNFEDTLGLTKEFRAIDKEQRDTARQTLADIISFGEGKSYDQLDPESKQQIINAVADSPLSLGLVKQAMARGKVAYDEARAKSRQSLGGGITTGITQGTTYTLRAGDDPYNIAQSYGVSIADLQSANPGIKDWKNIQPGVALNVPPKKQDAFVNTLLKTKGGKALTDTTIQKLDKGLTTLGQLGVLQSNIKDIKTGPIVGAFKGNNPWDTNAQTIKAQLNAIVPNLARGVYGEVGVLTDNDIATYSKTLPNLKSKEEVRNAVLYITLDMIGKSIQNTLSTNAAAGRDVSGFVDIYTNMEEAKNSILNQIPTEQVPTAFQQTVAQNTSSTMQGTTPSGVTWKVIK